MLKKLFVLSFIATSFLSCKKEDTCPYTESTFVAPASEVVGLQSYIAANHPAAIQHSSGLYYEITAPGTGTSSPDVCSNVNVKYSGYLINGVKFDESLTGVVFKLGGLILGWQKGIPLIKKGGSINLYLPPSLGYGASGGGSIPPNSILVFVIQLVDFN